MRYYSPQKERESLVNIAVAGTAVCIITLIIVVINTILQLI